jgi:hypothetical protein
MGDPANSVAAIRFAQWDRCTRAKKVFARLVSEIVAVRPHREGDTSN